VPAGHGLFLSTTASRPGPIRLPSQCVPVILSGGKRPERNAYHQPASNDEVELYINPPIRLSWRSV
jgi:hypothetical protein